MTTRVPRDTEQLYYDSKDYFLDEVHRGGISWSHIMEYANHDALNDALENTWNGFNMNLALRGIVASAVEFAAQSYANEVVEAELDYRRKQGIL